MNILYLAPEISIPGTHGGSSHVSAAVDSFVSLGHHVILLSRSLSGASFIERRHSLTILRVPGSSFSWLKNFLYVFSSFILTFVLSFWLDIVYERGRIFGGMGCVVSSFFGKKSFYEMVEPYIALLSIEHHYDQHPFLYRLIVSWHDFVVRRASRVLITHPSFLPETVFGHFQFTNTGVNTKIFNPHAKDPRIREHYHLIPGKTFLYAGSFSSWHSCENIIRAFSSVVRKDPEAKLMMIGEGKKFLECLHLVKKLKLQHSVLLTGKLPFELLPAYIATADVCLSIFDIHYLPFRKLSYFYSPIKVHEYKASGKPIISSNFGTLRELVKPLINGILVRDSSSSEIASAMRYCLEHPSFVTRVGVINRKEAETLFDWDVINAQLLKSLFPSFNCVGKAR